MTRHTSTSNDRPQRKPQPRPGTAGHLTVGDGTSVPVSVAGGGEAITLVLLVDPGEHLEPATEGVVLESQTSRGLVRMRGKAERLDSGLVRFWVDGDPQVLQRRQFVRVIAPQRVTLDDSCGTEIDTHSVNVSGGGMLLSGPESLDVDVEVNFKLYLSEREPPVAGVGRVIRALDSGQRAIVFEDISQTDRERLIHFIFDRQRAALAYTRGDTV
jgi:hypothetical protein